MPHFSSATDNLFLIQKSTLKTCQAIDFLDFYCEPKRPVSEIQYFPDPLKLKISCNQTIKAALLGLDEHDIFDWYVINEMNDTIADQSNGSLFSYSFKHKGTFQLVVYNLHKNEHQTCSHDAFVGNWLMEVSAERIEFDLENIVFSKPLTASNLEAGLEFTVPISVEIYDESQKDYLLSSISIQFHGVDCQIMVKPVSPKAYANSGKTSIVFLAIGKARPKSYVMIDFIDHNGITTTYYHPNEL